jgi:hypothetical protein
VCGGALEVLVDEEHEMLMSFLTNEMRYGLKNI